MEFRLACLLLGLVLSACNLGDPEIPAASAAAPPVSSSDDWMGFGWDAARSSRSTAPTGINPSNVSSLRRQQVQLDGTIDAAVIYLGGVRVNDGQHNVFFATTTYGKTMAIDADQGTVLWTYTPPGYAGWAGTYQITNTTPVADPDRRFVYAASPDGRIQKLAVADGQAVWRTAITTLPAREKIAAPLNFDRGHLVAATGGYIGDRPPYQGHIAILGGESGRIEHVWNSLCSDHAELLDPKTCAESGSAIWGRAGPVIDPETGNIFVATGNGRWDGKTNWGDATLVLDPEARLIGNYTPSNTEELSRRDQDLGSTSPALLGGGYFVQGGKDGRIRLLTIRGILGVTPHRGGEIQSVSTPSGQGLFTAPAVVHAGEATWLFAADNGGTAAWVLRGDRLDEAWRNANPGTSPVVAGGLLYVYDPHGGLRIYEPQSGRELSTLECGTGHWNSPIVIDGRIALPEGNANTHRESGVLDIWRLPQ
jgi:outer membrane protein assembly factor BamB